MLSRKPGNIALSTVSSLVTIRSSLNKDRAENVSSWPPFNTQFNSFISSNFMAIVALPLLSSPASPAIKLRSAFAAAVWSWEMSLANPGAILSLLDGPGGCGPGFFCCLVKIPYDA